MLKKLVTISMLVNQIMGMEDNSYGFAGNVANSLNSQEIEFSTDIKENVAILGNQSNKQKRKIIKLKDRIVRLEQEKEILKQQGDYHEQTLTLLQQRIIVLETKESNFIKLKKYIPNPFNHCGLLGAGVALSEVFGEHICGYRNFKNKSFPGICGELAIIAGCGYLFSHVARFIDQKCGFTQKVTKALDLEKTDLEWIPPTLFAMAAGAAVQDVISFNPKEPSTSQTLICSFASVITGLSIHLYKPFLGPH